MTSFLATTAITIGFQGVGFAVGTSYELSEFSRYAAPPCMTHLQPPNST
jgi:hypothetical protein